MQYALHSMTFSENIYSILYNVYRLLYIVYCMWRRASFDRHSSRAHAREERLMLSQVLRRQGSDDTDGNGAAAAASMSKAQALKLT